MNDDPVLDTISDISFDEDGSDSITLIATDIDNDALFYTISNGTDIVATINGATITFLAPNHFHGSETFTASVSDGTTMVSENFTVTIHPVNDDPILTTVSDISFVEDGSGSISLIATDIDNDTLNYTISNLSLIHI